MSSNGVNGDRGEQPGRALWRHPAPETSQMWEYLQQINSRNKFDLKTYDELYQWSIDNIGDFWATAWDFTGIRASTPYDEVAWRPE